MMEYEFRSGDNIFTVNIEKPGERSEIPARINEKAIQVAVSQASPNCFIISSAGPAKRVYAVSSDGNVFVFIDGITIKLDKILADQPSYSREGLEFGAKDQVTTPMPGKVVKILVKEGERVSLKQPLVIVESMKMENEIKSPSNGTIKSIHFKPGDLVESNKPIIKILPDD